MFVSTHYAGKTVTIEFKEGEAYKKVFGPIFIYLNSAPSKDKFKSLWSDAKQKVKISLTITLLLFLFPFIST
jgi:rhamnogalacturonan endolyase